MVEKSTVFFLPEGYQTWILAVTAEDNHFSLLRKSLTWQIHADRVNGFRLGLSVGEDCLQTFCLATVKSIWTNTLISGFNCWRMVELKKVGGL